MPYPNSQTPVTIRLNALFGNPAQLPAQALTDLQDNSKSLADLAITTDWAVVAGPAGSVGYEHVANWPINQQKHLRKHMILSIRRNIPMDFDWHSDSMTAFDIVILVGDRIGVTFSSPLVYPPYWGS